jgi:alanine racemase
MFESSVIELSRSALASNIKYIRKIIGNEIVISTVVKGNAYGHGIDKFVELAESCGMKHFSVYGADEALRVFQNSKPDSEIVIMGWIDKPEIAWAIENNIQFYVFNFERLYLAINAAKKLNKKARIHIELETGMNRVGFHATEFKQLFSLLDKHSDRFIIEGISTHYAGAESVANYVRIQKQHKKYKDAIKLSQVLSYFKFSCYHDLS